jgi:hypothetical protein
MKGDVTLIASEIAYFQPMLERALRSSAAEREAWRAETIRQRQERISLEVFEMLNGVVRYGRFKGLLLSKDTWWGRLDLGSQCLGLYELEILDFIASITPGRFATFIDVGAADGYYAIGMLKSGLVTKAICFEQSEKGRSTIQANWERNASPGSLEIFAEANHDSIRRLPTDALSGGLVMIDIEGAEFGLLTPRTLEFLRSCTIVIEIHNWVEGFVERYTRLLTEASEYFDIHILERMERPTATLPELRDFTDDNRLLLVSERRPCLMRFLKLLPKSA